MKLTLTLLLVAALAFTLPLVGCKKETTPANNAAVNVAPSPVENTPTANAPENKERLKRQTEEATARGLFGAPSFTVGDELFWGNDRLEDAIAWAAKS